ncbi:MAG: exopolyphosphatase [Pseudomonadales bacterium]
MAEPSLQAASQPGNQLAALDLGSNSFHLLVAQESNGRIQVVDKIKDMVRLAEGLDAAEHLSEPVAQRALASLERFGQRLRELPPHNVRVVATSTLRRATNAADFLRRAEAVLGHRVEVISGREEARLIYQGVANALEDNSERRLVVDIGGGSTELILGRNYTPELMESLHLGCVELSRTHFADGKLRSSRLESAVAQAKQELEPVQRTYRESGWDSAIGASGTILAAQEVLRQMGIDQDGITHSGLRTLGKRLFEAKSIDKISLPGLPAERAPVFPGGLAILMAVFEELGIDRMQATSGALREGVIHDLLGRAHHQDVRERTVRDLSERYHIDSRHARCVRETALSLLAQVALDWQLTDSNDRLMLGWAADLHEIGFDIAHNQYHKHGGYLLEHMDMPGFSSWDQRTLAALVRAHRRKFPMQDGPFAGSHAQRMIRLATLLRLSVLLHRNRSSTPLPHVGLRASGANLTLVLPGGWLRRHALTRLDLEQETAFLAAVPLSLSVTRV